MLHQCVCVVVLLSVCSKRFVQYRDLVHVQTTSLCPSCLETTLAVRTQLFPTDPYCTPHTLQQHSPHCTQQKRYMSPTKPHQARCPQPNPTHRVIPPHSTTSVGPAVVNLQWGITKVQPPPPRVPSFQFPLLHGPHNVGWSCSGQPPVGYHTP